jgi:hypothetical protein
MGGQAITVNLRAARISGIEFYLFRLGMSDLLFRSCPARSWSWIEDPLMRAMSWRGRHLLPTKCCYQGISARAAWQV